MAWHYSLSPHTEPIDFWATSEMRLVWMQPASMGEAAWIPARPSCCLPTFTEVQIEFTFLGSCAIFCGGCDVGVEKWGWEESRHQVGWAAGSSQRCRQSSRSQSSENRFIEAELKEKERKSNFPFSMLPFPQVPVLLQECWAAASTPIQVPPSPAAQRAEEAAPA